MTVIECAAQTLRDDFAQTQLCRNFDNLFIPFGNTP
jgi:hypothetical protein